VVTAVLITAMLLAVGYVLWRGAHVLLEAFAGLLFAVFLAATSNQVSRHTHLSRGRSLALVVVGLCLLASGLVYLSWSLLSTQIGEMLQALPRSLGQIKSHLMQYPWGSYLVKQAPGATGNLVAAGRFTEVTGFVSGVAGFLEATVVILIVGIFGAAEPDLYRAGLIHLVPPPHRPRVGEVVDAIASNLRQWLVGQLLLMVIIGVTTAAGLWLIGIPMALALGLIAGVLELVPYVGAWLSAALAAMIALLKGPQYLGYVLALYLALHVLEGYVLLPLIQRRAVHLPPALTLVAQALLGEMHGPLGLFVAAPLTVATMVALKMLYVEDTLGDEDVDVAGEPGAEARQAIPAG
jgi:predicted PurR-regulated permease PerM